MRKPPSAAPAPLDQVRTLLNTWHIPHEQRVPVDDLPSLATRPRAWRATMPDIPPPSSAAEVAELTRLRTALRDCLGHETPHGLADWLDRHPITATIGTHKPIAYRAGSGAVPQTLMLVVDAIARAQWPRLKACPDCRHVFYDHSRNRSRTWCGMYAGAPEGRACGSIAKVRAYRDRQRIHGS